MIECRRVSVSSQYSIPQTDENDPTCMHPRIYHCTKGCFDNFEVILVPLSFISNLIFENCTHIPLNRLCSLEHTWWTNTMTISCLLRIWLLLVFTETMYTLIDFSFFYTSIVTDNKLDMKLWINDDMSTQTELLKGFQTENDFGLSKF